MKRTTYFPMLSITALLLLSGCGRIIDWGKTNFYQGQEMPSFSQDVKPFLRSVTIYDQLETKAWFDLLWLSDEVRTAYAKLHVERMGQSEEKYQAVLRRQLEENSHYITFYVLSTHETKLGTPDSQWSLFLRVNGKDYQPFEFKKVDLPYEYQQFFGSYWNRFKEPYLLRFQMMDENEKPLINEFTPAVQLYVRSADKEHLFTWPLHEVITPPAPIIKKKKPKKMKSSVTVPRQHWPRKRKGR